MYLTLFIILMRLIRLSHDLHIIYYNVYNTHILDSKLTGRDNIITSFCLKRGKRYTYFNIVMCCVIGGFIRFHN